MLALPFPFWHIKREGRNAKRASMLSKLIAAKSSMLYPAIPDNDRVDVKIGKMSYFQRIQIGQVLEKKPSSETIHRVFFDILQILHPKVKIHACTKNVEYFHIILDGIKIWYEREKTLKYEPDAIELRAGIRQLEQLKDLPTRVALSKHMARPLHEIDALPYHEVFAILLSDYKTAKFRKNYQKEVEKEQERKNRHGRNWKR